MSALTFKLREPPQQRLNLSKLNPGALANLGVGEIEKLVVGAGAHPMTIGDAFAVSGDTGPSVVIQGGSERLDYVGAGLNGGTLTVEGDVGTYAGAKMESGRLEIRGSAGPFLASSLIGGLVVVAGSAGDNLGTPRRGERDGIAGGTVYVAQGIGQFAAARMRRGTIITPGAIGGFVGERMMGGTIWTETGFGESPGVQMRRGTLIGPKADRILPTFVDCGVHDLSILKIIARHVSGVLGELAPKPLPDKVRRFAGDMASIGKGELLLTA